MTPLRPVPLRLLPAALALAALTGCGASETAADPEPDIPEPHGYVEGAEETAEQQSRLVLLDSATGQARVLDLITGESEAVGPFDGSTRLTTDGRFGHLHSPTGAYVLDTGAWMVDHGDHVHYYRAAVQDVGEIADEQPVRIRADAGVVAVTAEDGSARLHPREEWESGTIGDPVPLDEPAGGPVVPFREHLVSLRPGQDPTGVDIRDRDGATVATLDEECPDPGPDAVTRRGVVFGCADGALLVSESQGEFTAERIPFDAEVPAAEQPREFHGRPGSNTLTALSGDSAALVLDLTDRTWTRVETGPALAATTAGEGAPLLVISADGALDGYDIATGERTSTDELLAPPEGPEDEVGRPVIEIDASRAYVNDPAAALVHEIDYNDGLRVARTFDTDITPTHMVETGR